MRLDPELLAFARDLAEEAGATTLRWFGADPEVTLKDDDSPVTVADREAEALCRRRLEERFPDDGIVGEEYGVDRPGAARRWILDPIDGTRSFIRGVPLYGVLIALEIEGTAALGVMHFPALGQTVAAGRGLGCWAGDRRVAVSEIDTLSQALALTTDELELVRQERATAWRRLTDRVGMARTWGDCYGHALVATGRAEIMVDPILALWDAAALQPIVEEAGGVYAGWDGRRDHQGASGISVNARLADEVFELLGVGDGAAG